jgi:hypothetical protein
MQLSQDIVSTLLPIYKEKIKQYEELHGRSIQTSIDRLSNFCFTLEKNGDVPTSGRHKSVSTTVASVDPRILGRSHQHVDFDTDMHDMAGARAYGYAIGDFSRYNHYYQPPPPNRQDSFQIAAIPETATKKRNRGDWPNQGKWCDFCKRTSHTREECRKAPHNSRVSVTSQPNPQAVFTAQPTDVSEQISGASPPQTGGRPAQRTSSDHLEG